jgi:hypothetical protein
MKSAALVVAGLLAAGGAAAGEHNAYMPTNGARCTDRSRQHEGAWSCPGPAGYAADFSDEGNLAAFAIRPPGRMEKVVAYVFPGRDRVFGDIVDWHVVDGAPRAAVLRVWRAVVLVDGSEAEVQELVVFKVGLRETCRIASVNVRQPAANEAARRLAGHAIEKPCADPQ